MVYLLYAKYTGNMEAGSVYLFVSASIVITKAAIMSSLTSEEFAEICESSDESDVDVVDIEREINRNRKRIREDISCSWCHRKVSKTVYYDRHKNGLCRKESSPRDQEDLNISSNQEIERLPLDEDLVSLRPETNEVFAEGIVAPLNMAEPFSDRDASLAEVIYV